MRVPTMLTDLEQMPVIQVNGYDVRIETDPMLPATAAIAEQELRETPDVKAKAVEELRELLKAETDLSVPIDNDLWLIRFLRPTKYYPESARDLIKRYYSFKVKHADSFGGLVPAREQNIFNANILTVMTRRDQCGRRMLLLELGKRWKHKEVSLDEVFRGCVLVLEAAMLEPETQVAGVVVIFDMDGLSLQQTWQFTPMFAKRIVDWLQDAIPLRVKGLHVVNQPKIFQVVFALFKPFLREKLRNRIVFHGTDRASLHKYLSPKVLPAAYGGTSEAPRVDGEHWYKLLQMIEAEFVALNQYGYPAKH